MAADASRVGRVIYETFAAAWPTMPDAPRADRMNGLPKYVASRTTSTGVLVLTYQPANA